MPDPELNDPVDDVYRQAEAALNDDAARAARRARVLAAVAAEVAPTPRATDRTHRLHPAWMATAAALTLSVIIAVNIPRPISTAPSQPSVAASSDEKTLPPAPPQAAQTAEAVEKAAGVKADAPPVVQAPRAAAPEESSSGVVARPAPAARARADEAIVSAPPPMPPLPLPPVPAPVAESPKPAPAPPAPSASTFGASDHAEPSSAKAFDTRRASPAGLAPTAAAELAERMRAAAAAGRTEEVEALLAQGVPVDAADSEGETALMKSVRAGRLATAGLLRRRGASLDHANTSGETVRALAAAKADPQLDKALDLPR